jgi:50S ribosomal protein L16 3-hydroxylase
MKINWQELTPEIFLKEYWQKKPLIIKNAFKDFEDPITADELAGLAMEQEIESRIVAQHKQASDNSSKWHVNMGPFEDFEQYGEDHWTLLVQAVNNWSNPTHKLMAPFSFLPNWRLDDVMVSFSTPQGGVGPHLDQYDVFIIQGEGRRRWQVGLPDDSLETLIPHTDLKQVSDFTPFIDEITEPGDLLYIPPNHPHNGVAIENSLNYSIGFQAPNTQELWSSFADKLLDENIGTERLADKTRTVTKQPEQLVEQDIAKIKRFMLNQLEDASFFEGFIGSALTQSHHAMEILIPVTPITNEQLDDIFADNDIVFTPVLGIKSLITESPKQSLYINGEQINLCENTQKLAQVIAKKQPLAATQVKSFIPCLKNRQLLTNLLNKGYWYIE